jgi:hypothetical protein
MCKNEIIIKPKRLRPYIDSKSSKRSVERILRQAAYVLQLTQRVKEAILAEEDTAPKGGWC